MLVVRELWRLPSTDNWLRVSKFLRPILIPGKCGIAVRPYELADTPRLVPIYEIQCWKVTGELDGIYFEENALLGIV